MTTPSVAEVMRSVSSRAPSMRWVGASDEMIQLDQLRSQGDPAEVEGGDGAGGETGNGAEAAEPADTGSDDAQAAEASPEEADAAQ